MCFICVTRMTILVFGPMRGVFCKPQSLRFDVQTFFGYIGTLPGDIVWGRPFFCLLSAYSQARACRPRIFFLFLGSPATPQTQGLRAGRHAGNFFFVDFRFLLAVLVGIFALVFFFGFLICAYRELRV